MRKTNRQKGITLVALIITIIILLILAGISIASLTQTGLFTKAKEAKQNTLDAQLKENATLNEYDEWIAKYGGKGGSSEGQPITNVDTSKTNPEGAKPKGATVIEGDATKGIVIKDSNNNEWVWVEVPKNITEGKTTDAEIETALQTYAGDYREGKTGQGCNWTDEWYNGCGMSKDEYNTAKSKMLQSIKTNGGFWISRYEAGIEGTNTDETINEIPNVRYEHNNITKDSPKAVSQANRIPYNHVYCSEAQKLASAMSTDSNKTSSLLFGIQWDLTCKFLEIKTDLKTEDIKTNSVNWGNYKNSSIKLTRGRYNVSPENSSSVWKKFNVDTDNVTGSQTSNNENYMQLLTTGASEETKKMNIYDFAGNEGEWTLEKTSSYTKYHCASKGGSFIYNSSESPASYRRSDHTTVSYSYISFRSTLY